MIYIAYTIHVVVCFFLIMVVLLQQGKGADLSVFGGGATQSAFGARGAATLLHKLTVAGFVAFIFTTVGIGLMQSGSSSDSVMSTVVEEAVPEAPAIEGELIEAEAAVGPVDAGDSAVDETSTEEGEPAEEASPPDSEQ